MNNSNLEAAQFEIDVILDEYQTKWESNNSKTWFEIDVILDEYQTLWSL